MPTKAQASQCKSSWQAIPNLVNSTTWSRPRCGSMTPKIIGLEYTVVHWPYVNRMKTWAHNTGYCITSHWYIFFKDPPTGGWGKKSGWGEKWKIVDKWWSILSRRSGLNKRIAMFFMSSKLYIEGYLYYYDHLVATPLTTKGRSWHVHRRCPPSPVLGNSESRSHLSHVNPLYKVSV